MGMFVVTDGSIKIGFIDATGPRDAAAAFAGCDVIPPAAISSHPAHPNGPPMSPDYLVYRLSPEDEEALATLKDDIEKVSYCSRHLKLECGYVPLLTPN